MCFKTNDAHNAFSANLESILPEEGAFVAESDYGEAKGGSLFPCVEKLRMGDARRVLWRSLQFLIIIKIFLLIKYFVDV